MGNLYLEFKKEMGYTNISNQYIEMISRLFQENHNEEDIGELSRGVGLMVSSIPDNISSRMSRQYIVGIHTCIERFLNEFKSLPGSPTYKVKYDPKADISRLKWTVHHCYKRIPDEVKDLMNICEYYRHIRNGIVHAKYEDSGEMKMIKSSISLSDDNLRTKIYGNLVALNDIEKIVLSENTEQIDHIIQKVKDNKNKKTKKIKKYLSGIYPIFEEEKLDIAIDEI